MQSLFGKLAEALSPGYMECKFAGVPAPVRHLSAEDAAISLTPEQFEARPAATVPIKLLSIA